MGQSAFLMLPAIRLSSHAPQAFSICALYHLLPTISSHHSHTIPSSEHTQCQALAQTTNTSNNKDNNDNNNRMNNNNNCDSINIKHKTIQTKNSVSNNNNNGNT